MNTSQKRLEYIKNWQNKNQEKYKLYCKKSRDKFKMELENNPTKKEFIKQRNKQLRDNWWKIHPEKYKEYNNKFKFKNYQAYLDIKKLRTKRKKINGGSHTHAKWELLKNKYNFTCPCCDEKEPLIKLTKDHIIPLSKGGNSNIENIQPLCMSCNNKKWNKIIKF